MHLVVDMRRFIWCWTSCNNFLVDVFSESVEVVLVVSERESECSDDASASLLELEP